MRLGRVCAVSEIEDNSMFRDGNCEGTCVERIEAFQLANAHDPTEYE